MEIVYKVNELKERVNAARQSGKTIGLVPTMGALHEGHASLVKKARRDNDVVVVSVFVNPTQFNNPEDLEKYPRTEAEDAKLLKALGADVVFMPTPQEVYGGEAGQREYDLGPVAQVMEGPLRPGHFNGVANIVDRLFEWTQPHKAYFGEKDFQQIAVIRRLLEITGRDLELVSCPIVREKDGLAMSSRNMRLDAEHRRVAPLIHEVLAKSTLWAKDGMSVKEVADKVIADINQEPLLEVEYYTVSDAAGLQPVDAWPGPGKAVGCIAVYCGGVRLIDNIIY